jgi:hypothetical protein
MFYFRNPFTNWSFSTWKVLPHRLQSIRVLVLDETIGDPAIVFGSPKTWKRCCTRISIMSGLRVLYINIDTLYRKAWTSEREERLLAPISAIQIPELHVVVRWSRPRTRLEQLSGSTEDALQSDFSHTHLINPIRVDSYDDHLLLYQDHPAADMRTWIIRKLEFLSTNAV